MFDEREVRGISRLDAIKLLVGGKKERRTRTIFVGNRFETLPERTQRAERSPICILRETRVHSHAARRISHVSRNDEHRRQTARLSV